MNEDEKRELIENDFQVQQLIQHPGWTVLLDFVVNGSGGLRHWQNALLGGGAKTTESYQHMVGKIQGCEHVIAAPARIQEIADRAREPAETTE